MQTQPRRVAVYVRTSTKDQDGAGQIHALESFLQQAPARWQLMPNPKAESHHKGFFVDIGHTGAKLARPALTAILERIKNFADVDCILILSLDRLGRSTKDLFTLSETIIEQGGVAIHEVKTGMDLDTQSPIGRLYFTMLAAFAAFEREQIVERVAAGIKAARAKGQVWGRGHSKKRVTLGDKVMQLRSRGLSLAEIAAATGIPRTTVHRIIKTNNAPRKYELKIRLAR